MIRSKKILMLILAIILIVTCVPMTAMADTKNIQEQEVDLFK